MIKKFPKFLLKNKRFLYRNCPNKQNFYRIKLFSSFINFTIVNIGKKQIYYIQSYHDLCRIIYSFTVYRLPFKLFYDDIVHDVSMENGLLGFIIYS